MDTNKRTLLQNLINRAEQSKKERYGIKIYDSHMLGKMEVEKLPVFNITKILDDVASAETSEQYMAKKVEAVYKFMPIFREKELHIAYEVDEPTDIVLAVLQDNLGELNNMNDFILDMYGLRGIQPEKTEDEATEEVKN